MRQQLIFILFLLTATAFGQSLVQNIRGKVVDEVTAYPLPGATVLLLDSESNRGVSTDANGCFEINEVPVGRQSIMVSFIGYETKTVSNFLLTSAKEVFLEVRLREQVTTMNELLVQLKTDKENAINNMAVVSSRSISIEETERFAGSLGDPARMASAFAGVMSQSDTRNDIVIRGNSPMGVQWRLDGMEIPNPNHFAAMGTTGGPVSMLNNNLLTRSDFLTGAFPAEFGNALSGIFDLNMRSGNNKQREYVGQVGFNGFELGAEGPFGKTGKANKASYLANFRYSTLDVINRLGFDLGTGFAIPKYKDLTFIIDVPGTKLGRFKVIGLWGESLMQLGRQTGKGLTTGFISRGTATDFGSSLGFLGLTHVYYFNEKTRIRTTLSGQYAESTTLYDSIYTQPNRTVTVYSGLQSESKLTFTSEFKQKINDKNNYSIGVILDKYMINYVDSTNFPEFHRFVQTLDINGDIFMTRAYAQWQHIFSNKLSVYGGLYYQYFGLNNQITYEPRLSLKWQMSRKSIFTLGYGKHSQTQPKSIYYHQFWDSGTDSYSKTNIDLSLSKSDHYVMGYNLMLNRDLRVKLEAYYQYLYDIPGKRDLNTAFDRQFAMVNAGDFFTIPKENFLENNVKGENHGLEFTFEKFLNRGYYFLLTTSLFESKYKPSDGVWRNNAFNGNFVVNVLGGYEISLSEKAMITIDLKTVLAGGRRYVPFDIERSIATHSAVKNWDRAWENKYDNYFRTDLRLGFKYNIRKVSAEWGVDLQNLTNYKSIFMEEYDVNRGELYQVYQQGFLPMVLFRIQF